MDRNEEAKRKARVRRLKRSIESNNFDIMWLENEIKKKQEQKRETNQGTENQDRSSNENKSGTTEREPDSTGSN